jgi:hypothetical protein
MPYPFFNTHFDNILPLVSRSSNGTLAFRLPYQHSVCISIVFYACYTLDPSLPPRLDHPNNIWCAEQDTKLHVAKFSLNSGLSVLGPNVFLSATFL